VRLGPHALHDGRSLRARRAAHVLRDVPRRLIFRGDRLVNWDCALQTAVADDELYKETVQGKFYYLRYPVKDPASRRADARDRGDDAARDDARRHRGGRAPAIRRGAARGDRRAQQQKLAAAPAKEKAAAQHELDRLQARERDLLPACVQIAAMARRPQGALPLIGRRSRSCSTTWADPELGTGCVKITPAHDPNDYAGLAAPSAHRRDQRCSNRRRHDQPERRRLPRPRSLRRAQAGDGRPAGTRASSKIEDRRSRSTTATAARRSSSRTSASSGSCAWPTSTAAS
jgi:hypothetical protein